MRTDGWGSIGLEGGGVVYWRNRDDEEARGWRSAEDARAARANTGLGRRVREHDALANDDSIVQSLLYLAIGVM